MARKKDTIAQIREFNYKTGRILGDVQAVRKGTIHKRIARRLLGKVFGRLIRAIVR